MTLASEATPATHAEDLLIVFGEVPSLGVGLPEVAREHGLQAAFRLRRLLLDTCLEHAGPLDVKKWFRYPEGTTHPMLPGEWEVRAHATGGIGELIDTALEEAFQRGYKHIVLFYADCPSLVVEFLESAFELLHDGADIVLGPTPKGGLYLIGAAPRAKGMFSLFPWRTPQLFEEAQREAGEHQLLVALLPRKDAVETLEDWRKVAQEGWIPPPPTISGGSGRPEG